MTLIRLRENYASFARTLSSLLFFAANKFFHLFFFWNLLKIKIKAKISLNKAVSHYLIAKFNAGTKKDFETWIKVYDVY